MFKIQERDVAEERVLTEQAHMTVGPLTDWISSAFKRHHGTGLVTGVSSVIFHGEVNEDSDGPVEALSIIGADANRQGAARGLHAHHEKATRLS